MCESATKWVREGGSRVLTQGGKVTAAGRAKGRVRKGRNGQEMGGGSSVWDRLSLGGDQSPQRVRHTYVQTNTR